VTHKVIETAPVIDWGCFVFMLRSKNMPKDRGIPVTLNARPSKPIDRIENIPQVELPITIGRDKFVTQRNHRRDLHQDLRDA
jgi:hypothetical protein